MDDVQVEKETIEKKLHILKEKAVQYGIIYL